MAMGFNNSKNKSVKEKTQLAKINTNEIQAQERPPINATIEIKPNKQPEEIEKGKTNSTTPVSPLKSEKPKRELPKSSSIGAMLKNVHKEYIVEQENDKVELTPENVAYLWKNFLEENKNNLQNAFLNVAQHQQPILEEDKLTFTVTNNISLEMLQLHKMEITLYFRKYSTSSTIAPDFILQKSDTTKDYKTPKDRLKDMIDNNPAVLNLIQKFNLNMD